MVSPCTGLPWPLPCVRTDGAVTVRFVALTLVQAMSSVVCGLAASPASGAYLSIGWSPGGHALLFEFRVLGSGFEHGVVCCRLQGPLCSAPGLRVQSMVWRSQMHAGYTVVQVYCTGP